MKIKDFTVSCFGPPDNSGVYIVCAKSHDLGAEHILYVGSSKNISNRVLHPAHPYNLIYNRFPCYLRFYETAEYRDLEKQMIVQYRPKLNKQHNGS